MNCNPTQTRYDISVIVVTYNQDVNKTLTTIHSILIQKDVTIQLIVADDGSDCDNFTYIKNYLESKKVEGYVLLNNNDNVGTVKNIIRCKSVCNSKYTKLISPGDFLYGDFVLKKWMDFMERGALAASFSNVIYYQNVDNTITPIKFKSFPQNTQIYQSKDKYGKRAFYQLVYNDYWLGSAVFCRTDVMFQYLKLIDGKVKYGEDNIYRIMAGDEIRRGYFKCNTMLYEYNIGVSSLAQRDDKWHRALLNDWYVTSRIILANSSLPKRVKKKLQFFSNWKMENANRGFSVGNMRLGRFILKLIVLYMNIPGLFLWHLKRYIHPRYTSTSLDMKLINRINSI